jgi:formylglycine-generating enzyme required for sulfatase activity
MEMTGKQVNVKNRWFLPAFLLFLLTLFFFSSCPQPSVENPEPWVEPEPPATASEPPAAPALPQVRPGNEKLVLSWDEVSGAAFYQIYCGETEPGEGASPLQTVNIPAATVSGLVNGTGYYVRLRAGNSAGLSGFGPSARETPVVQSPPPSVIRGNGELSAGWAAEEGIDYEIWYGTSGNTADAGKWNGPVSRSGVTAGTTITGLGNGTVYYLWIRPVVNGSPGEFSAGTGETPEAPGAVGGDFGYIPGGTVSGSDSYAVTVTVPNDPLYTNPGSSSVKKGVFVQGRIVPIPSFAMAKHETTQDLWYTVQTWALDRGYQFQNKKNKAPSPDQQNRPVTGISWRDAIVWCNAYSETGGLEPVYRDPGGNVLKNSTHANAAACDGALMDKTKSGYRLPTEVEREFAARGGNPGLGDWMYGYAGSNTADAVAWYHGNSPYQTQPVGTKAPNRLGVHDLSGNVQEWCWDWMNYAVSVTAASPPDGAAYSGTSPLANQKPFNGGGVGSNIIYSSVADRWGFTPDYTNSYVGFRVVRKP